MTVSISLPKPNARLCRIKSPYAGSGSTRHQIDGHAVGSAGSAGALGIHKLHRSRQPLGGRSIPGQRTVAEQDTIGEAVFLVLLVLRSVSAHSRMAGGPL